VREGGTLLKKRKAHTKSNTLKCSICHQLSHNSRSHREGDVPETGEGKTSHENQNSVRRGELVSPAKLMGTLQK